jgi:hypothetical protein
MNLRFTRRNLNILYDRINGETYTIISEKYGISRQRVERVIYSIITDLITDNIKEARLLKFNLGRRLKFINKERWIEVHNKLKEEYKHFL